MTWFLWTLLLIVICGMVAPGLTQGVKRIQFPFLAGVALSYHALLPFFVLIRQSASNPVAGLDRVLFMTILCVAAAWGGYHYRWTTNSREAWEFAPHRLATGAALLATFGVFAGMSVQWIDVQITEEGQMTGLATVLLFFSALGKFGFVIAAMLLIRTRKRWLWLVMLPQLWIYFAQLLVVRRSPMGELAVIVILLVYFARRWTPPLWLVAVVSMVFAILHFNVSTLRSTIGQPLGERIRVFQEGDPLAALRKSEMEEKEGFAVELYNAAHFMEAKARSGNFTYGRHFWNQIVFGWIPAQFVGREFKQSLQFKLPEDTAEIGFEKSFGTCETGIAEAYMAFWYFGALLFFGIGVWLRWLWDQSLAGSFLHQTILALSLFTACMTFSAQIWTYVNYLLQITVFALPVFYWSRRNSHGATSRGSKRPRRRVARSGPPAAL
jgi:hypothetical protein